MKVYEDIYEILKLPTIAADIAFSRIELPFFVGQLSEEYGFLPGLIPLWVDDGKLIGFWKHWFISREMTIVKEIPEFDFQHNELARSFNQLISLACFDDIISEEAVSDELERFSDLIGVKKIGKLNELYKKFGDEPACLLELEEFLQDPPLSCEPMKYRGDFPHYNMEYTKGALMKTCSTEYRLDQKEYLKSLDFAPIWLKEEDQAPLFYNLLKKSDFSGAWMSLNSNGWAFKDAKKAIIELAEKAKDPLFMAFSTKWASLPHENAGIY